MAGPGGVENAVEERDAEQRIGGAAVGLGGADRARQHAVELGLLGENPAGKAADPGRGGAARHAERLRQRDVDRAENENVRKDNEARNAP